MLNLPQLANPVHSEEEAKLIFKPYLELFRKAMDEGLEQVVSCSIRHVFDARADAAVLNCAIVRKAIAATSGRSDVKHVKGGNTCFFYIGIEAEALGVRSRFKKLGTNRRNKNLQTERQLMLMQQQQNIPGILPGTYLTLGYVLDPLGQKIEHHLITLQIGKKVIYQINIDEELAGADSNVTTMPIVHSPAHFAKPRVRPRVRATEQERKAKSKSAGQE